MLIRVIDLETCGFEPPKDGGSGVCEIGWYDLIGEGSSWRIGNGGSAMVHPGCAIPPETSAVHHIIDGDVAGSPTWDVTTPIVFTDKVDAFAAHNAKFERQWCTPAIAGDRPWICTHRVALRLWPEAPLHSNQGLRYWRRPDGVDRTIAALAHRAMPDAYITAHHLRDQLAAAPLADLIRWTDEPALLVRCSFGKHRGARWSEVPTDYLRWCAGQGMDENVAFTVRRELDRRRTAIDEAIPS